MALESIDCEKCFITIKEKTTRNGPNRGRDYYKCPKCGFYIFSDLVKYCRCGNELCLVKTSHIDKNPNEIFWWCPTSTGVRNRGCGFFKFINDEFKEVKEPTYHVPNASQASTSTTALGSSETAAPVSSEFVRGYLEGAIVGTEMLPVVLKDLFGKLNLE